MSLRHANQTSYKKGEKSKNWNGFKKGHKTWNKGLKGVQAGENGARWKGGLPNCEKCKKQLSQRHSKTKLCIRCWLTSDETKRKLRKISVLGLKAQSNLQESSIEKIVKEYLQKRGVSFRQQVLISKYMVDFLIDNLIVECDGDYWHNLEHIKRRDVLKDKTLKKMGYNILRLTETNIRNGSFENFFEGRIN